MRRFELPFLESCRAGLRRESYTAVNTVGLYECKNLRVAEDGLVRPLHNPMFGPSQGYLTMDYFPYPQLFNGKQNMYLVYSNTILTIDPSTDPWTYAADLTIYETDGTVYIESGFDSETDGASAYFHFADFFDNWFMFNGYRLFYRTYRQGMAGGTDTIIHVPATTTQITTGCEHMGRLITAGFSASKNWADDWDNIVDHWVSRTPGLNLSKDLSNNFVMWSSIGGGDFLLLIDPTLGLQGPLSSVPPTSYDEPYYLHLLKKNQLGFCPMTTRGDVHMVKSLGKNLMAYGEQGVTFMFPVIEPFPTFGIRHLLDVGTVSRAGVGGDDKRHLMVDASGTPWMIEDGKVPERLGYKEYISDLGTNISINYNSQEEEFMISGASGVAYQLTKQGLSKITNTVAIYLYADDELKTVEGSPNLDTELNDRRVEVCTDAFNCNSRAFKRITSIQLDYGSNRGAFSSAFSDDFDVFVDVEVAVDYKVNQTDDFTRTSFIKVSPEGTANPMVSGTVFRVVLRMSNWLKAKVDNITVFWQQIDKRSLRSM